MNRSVRSPRQRANAGTLVVPLVWSFDGVFATCLADAEDALRRAIVQVGDVASIGVLVELSLPALKSRVAAGDAIQPAWGLFLERLEVEILRERVDEVLIAHRRSVDDLGA